MIFFSALKKNFFLLVVLLSLPLAHGCGDSQQADPMRSAAVKTETRPAAEKTDPAVEAEMRPAAENTDPVHHQLTYLAGENGTVRGELRQRVEAGKTGTAVTAVPAEGYHFLGWSDGVSSPERIDEGLTEDKEVEAHFAVNQYLVSYSAESNGTIDGAAAQQIDHGGAASPVAALPAPGYRFVGWSDGLVEAKRQDVRIAGPLALTATFAPNIYTLTYSAGEHGSLEGKSPQLVGHGADAEPVVAVPAPGYHFVDWSDGVDTPARRDEKVTTDLVVSARFAVNTYRIGGTVTGLMSGNRLLLRNNGEDLEISKDGDFLFAGSVPYAAPYKVSVAAQPQMPAQTCSVEGGNGTVAGSDVSHVRVVCVPDTYGIGGKVFGLPAGAKIALRNSEGEVLDISGNGPFAFKKKLNNGSEYKVEVHQQLQKPNWTCRVRRPSGVVKGADVDNVEVDCFQQVALQVEPGIRKIRLSWNMRDFGGATFALCQSREAFTIGVDADGCRRLKSGVYRSKVVSPMVIDDLKNDVPYHFQLLVLRENGRPVHSETVAASAFSGLNDSGIDWCADNGRNRDSSSSRAEKAETCAALATSHPGQDALHGRDPDFGSRKLKKAGAGSAGFDFAKICRSGDVAGEGKCPSNPMPGNGPNNWGCTRDNLTGLTWQIGVGGALPNTYSWHQPDDRHNGGDPGLANGGRCGGSDCDTHAYVRRINSERLCGADDWRLPARKELLSIVDNSRSNPAGDQQFFPDLIADYYWSSSLFPDPKSAWQVNFLYGEAHPAEKSQAKAVRLVRGRSGTFNPGRP